MPCKNTIFNKFWLRLAAGWLLGSLLLGACLPPGSANTTGMSSPIPKSSVSVTKPTSLPATLTPAATAPSIDPVDPKNLKGITLQFWHPWSGTLQQEVDAITADFNQTNVWGIKVVINETGSAGLLFDLVMEGFKTGEIPDVFVTTPNQIFDLQNRSGDLLNLDSYIQDAQWGLNQQEVADYPLIFWNDAQKDGLRLGIPAQSDIHVLFYNETWAKELGFFAPPDTPAAFRQQVCSAAKTNTDDKDKANNGTGGWIINTDGLTMLSWMMAFGDQKFPRTDAETYQFNTPENRELYLYLRTLFDNNCAWISRDPLPYHYFATRSALFYSGTLQDIPPQTRAQTLAGSTDQWKVIAYPAGERKPVLLTSGTSYAMLKSSPEKQLAAWLFMRWMILPRNRAKVIESSGLLPVTHSTNNELVVYKNTYPQWEEGLMWVPLLTEAPALPSWRLVQSLVEDSGFQVFQPSTKSERVSDIPRQLDLMITDILKQRR